MHKEKEIQGAYDLILNDRREYIDKMNITLCEKGCEYEGDNIKTLNVICYCPIKINMNEEYDYSYEVLANNNKINNCKNNNLRNMVPTFAQRTLGQRLHQKGGISIIERAE